MPTPTTFMPRRPPPEPPVPARVPEAPPLPPATAARNRPPTPGDSVEDWYFCGEGSLYR